MKKLLLFSLLVFGMITVYSQSSQKPASTIFVELGGNGGLASINYDRRFSNGHTGLGWRVGVGAGAVPSHILFNFVATFPIGINYLLGNKSHHFEGGAGVTIGTEKFSPSGERISTVYFVPSLGYRLQRPGKGFSFRLFVSPFIGAKTEISGGISLGTSF